MKSAALQLQQTVITLARPVLGAVPLHDGAPRNAPVPFASFDEITTKRRDGLMAVIEEHRFAIRLVSRAGGKREAVTLADRMIAALDDARPPMTDHRVIRLYVDTTDSRMTKDRTAVETTLRFVCLTEPLVAPAT